MCNRLLAGLSIMQNNSLIRKSNIDNIQEFISSFLLTAAQLQWMDVKTITKEQSSFVICKYF